MRIHVLSDLHLEFADFDPPPTQADVVVLAGDIQVGLRGIHWATRVFANKPVLYVPGNHEFYGHAIPKLTGKLTAATDGTNIHVLERGAIQLGGCTFLGATLWTDFALFGSRPAAAYEAQTAMNDYRRIRVSPAYRRLQPSDTARIHAETRSWLTATAAEMTGPLVVVTHHAPSQRSVPVAYQGDSLTPAFASDMETLVEALGARLWIHGHLHTSSDYRLGRTRILCNPRGYHPDQLNPDFDSALTVDV